MWKLPGNPKCLVCGKTRDADDSHGTAAKADGHYLDLHEKRAHRFEPKKGEDD